MKLLEENIGKTIQDISIDNTFLNETLKVQVLEAKVDKCDWYQRSFCPAN